MKSNINKIRIGLALAVLFGLLGIANVGAQGSLSYTSSIQVVNLESTEASIDIVYYNSDGSEAGTLLDEKIAGNSSKTYFPLLGVGAGFKGSVVISSLQNIAAITNLVTTDFSYNASATGFSQGDTEFNLPLIMCNNGGFNTFFSVQNTSSGTDANVDIAYIPGSHGASGVTDSAVIKPGAAASFDQAVGSLTKDCNDLQGGTGKFVGSATITSNVPVVATVMQLNTTSFPILMGYNGFGSGSPIIKLPLIMANNGGFYTSVNVQNVGSLSTTVTVDYSANTGGVFDPANEVFSLDPGEGKAIIQSGSAPGNGSTNTWTSNKYVGAATVTSSNAQDLVVIVNEVSPGGSGKGPFGSSYEGFDPATATANVTAPLIMANNGGYYTSIQVQNVGVSNCASVTIDYGANSGGTFNPANEVFSLDAGLTKVIIQNGSPPNNGSTVNNWTTNKYVGSAAINAPGCSIVALVNEFANASGDRLLTYDGFNY